MVYTVRLDLEKKNTCVYHPGTDMLALVFILACALPPVFHALTTYEILITNQSPSSQDFFIFQKPAVFTGGAKVFSNSVGHAYLPGATAKTASQAKYHLETQWRAAAQDQVTPPVVGKGQTSAIFQSLVNLQTKGNTPTSDTTVLVSLIENEPVLGDPLTQSDSDVTPGSFRIKTPAFSPRQSSFNIGLGTSNNGELVISSFIQAEPSKNYDVQPIVIFYVAVGNYQAGVVVNYNVHSVQAALCDATNGQQSFSVTYNDDGTWTVQ